MSYEEADDLYDDFPNTYLFGLDGGKRIIDGFGVAAFVNHSCKPNCETDQIAGKMWIIALRDIEPGEELTYDYNLYDGEDDAPCYCGAKRCRGSLYSAAHLRKLKKKREKAAAAALNCGRLDDPRSRESQLRAGRREPGHNDISARRQTSEI